MIFCLQTIPEKTIERKTETYLNTWDLGKNRVNLQPKKCVATVKQPKKKKKGLIFPTYLITLLLTITTCCLINICWHYFLPPMRHHDHTKGKNWKWIAFYSYFHCYATFNESRIFYFLNKIFKIFTYTW